MQKHVVDLHVHTPASHDYKGHRDRKGYTELLKIYSDAGVSTIAITDHNCISGYEEIIKLREDTKRNYELNSSRDDAAELIKKLNEELLCYSKITILPGIEISAFPGIHIILLFKETVDINAVKDFINSDLEIIQCEKPVEESIKFPPLMILEKAAKRFHNEFICYLPHADSSKGAWQELDGLSRAELIKSNLVYAIQIVNPENKKRISETLLNPIYKRDKPIKFIQASDFHGEPLVQPAHQYIEVESEKAPDFDTIRQLFRSNTNVRISSDSLEDSLQELVKGKQVLRISIESNYDLNQERLYQLCKDICAVLNTQNTVVQITLLNIKSDPSAQISSLKELINKCIEKIDPPEKFSYKLYDFSFSETRRKILLSNISNRRIRMFDDHIWVRDKGVTRSAGAWEIERIVSDTIFQKYGKNKQKELSSSSHKILMISNSYPAFGIAARVDRLLGNTILNEFETELIVPEYDIKLENIAKYGNGTPAGEYYLINVAPDLSGGRRKEKTYYRFSCPQCEYDNSNLKEIKSSHVPKNSIIIFPGGGVNYCAKELPVYAPHPIFVISAKDDSEQQKDVLLGLCAYFKTCFFLWYLLTINNTDDLFSMAITKRNRIPLPNDLKLMKSLARLTRNILIDETNLLHKINKMTDGNYGKDHISKEVESHNNSCNSNMRLIEKIVLSHIGIGREESIEIFRVISELGYFDYEIMKNMKKFEEELFSSSESNG